MKFNNYYIPFVLIYLFFCASLFVGFYFNENSSGGSTYDFNIHLKTVKYFNDNVFEALINYHKLGHNNTHSPIFIIFLAPGVKLCFYSLGQLRLFLIGRTTAGPVLRGDTSAPVGDLCQSQNSGPREMFHCWYWAGIQRWCLLWWPQWYLFQLAFQR